MALLPENQKKFFRTIENFKIIIITMRKKNIFLFNSKYNTPIITLITHNYPINYLLFNVGIVNADLYAINIDLRFYYLVI